MFTERRRSEGILSAFYFPEEYLFFKHTYQIQTFNDVIIVNSLVQ